MMNSQITKLPSSESLFENAACGLLVTDTNGLIQKTNTTFCQWIDYPATELNGKLRIQDLFTEDCRRFYQLHWTQLLQNQGSIAEVQLDMHRRNGDIMTMVFNAVRRQHGKETFDEIALFVATDQRKYERELLLARKTAEDSFATLQETQESLKESRNVLSLAMRGAKMGAWSYDFVSETIWWSRELELLLGAEAGSLLEKKEAFEERLHPEDRQGVINFIDQFPTVSTDYVTEFRLLHTNGKWIPLEARGLIVFDSEDKPRTLLGIVIDISERHIVEAQLRELNEQLSKADVRKDEFLATLAHELRTPLAPMRNVLEILKAKNLGDPQVRWAQGIFERQLQQITRLVEDLMEISRISNGRLELRKHIIDLIPIMQAALEIFDTHIKGRSHQLHVELPSEPIMLNADSTRLIQIISNLLTNAFKYTPNGGDIWVSIKKEPNNVLIVVKDSGIGIPKEHLSNVFDMFSQLTPALERSQGGLGIGLALVQGLVQLHEGSVIAQSDGVGKGSTFIVRLPITTIAAASSEVYKSISLEKNRSCQILVIDDNIDAADSLEMLLDMQGYKVIIANDGQTGLEKAVQFSPEVILLDIGLPDINGYEVARRIRETSWGKDIALFAITGWGQEEDIRKAIEAGFDHHLIKPIDFNELEKLLKKNCY